MPLANKGVQNGHVRISLQSNIIIFVLLGRHNTAVDMLEGEGSRHQKYS